MAVQRRRKGGVCNTGLIWDELRSLGGGGRRREGTDLFAAWMWDPSERAVQTLNRQKLKAMCARTDSPGKK